MRFAFDDEQEALRGAARAFLAKASPAAEVRRTMETELGWDPSLWRRMSEEMGWTALLVPEAHGGLGLGFVELAALSEELGRAVACAPFFATVGLGVNALLLADARAETGEALAAIATGEATATLALTGSRGRPGLDGIEAIATADGEGVVLDGVASFVVDGHSATHVVVAARAPGSTGADGVTLALVAGDAPGIARRRLPTMDATRRLGELRFERVSVPRARLLTDAGAAGAVLERVLSRAAVALAAEQVGGAEQCLDATVAYAKVREQFGRPIGSFQAVKHRAADMLVAVETARTAALHAAWCAATDAPDLDVRASLAKAWCSDAYFRCAADAIQLHGGIGFTWEHEAHLHFKRARASASLLGDAAWHRERIASRAIFAPRG